MEEVAPKLMRNDDKRKCRMVDGESFTFWVFCFTSNWKRPAQLLWLIVFSISFLDTSAVAHASLNPWEGSALKPSLVTQSGLQSILSTLCRWCVM